MYIKLLWQSTEYDAGTRWRHNHAHTIGTLRDDVKTCTHLTANNPPAEPSSRRIPLYL